MFVLNISGILLVFALLIGVYVLYFFFRKKVLRRFGSKTHINMISVYVVFILVTTIIFRLLVAPGIDSYATGNGEKTRLFELNDKGQISIRPLPEEFMKEKWRIPVNENELLIKANDSYVNPSSHLIYIERSDQEEVEAVLYETPLIINFFESGEIAIDYRRGTFEKDDSTLLLKRVTAAKSKEVSVLGNPFVINQFKRSKNPSGDMWDDQPSQQVLHLFVPDKVNVVVGEDMEHLVHYK